MSVLPKAIIVETKLILNAAIPKDHSDVLALLDTLATTMDKLVKVNILRLITF